MFSRKCPTCNGEIKYKTKGALNSSIRRGSRECRTCSAKTAYKKRKAEGNWNCTNKGMDLKSKREKPKYWKLCPTDGCDELIGYTKLYRLKRNPNTKCKRCNSLKPETLIKIIDKATDPSDETRLKMRNSAINRISKSHYNGGQVKPNYNPSSIPIIEAKANELGITDLQHAENGGEFYIKELGYFVDGYSKEKNIVIEYDEKHHKRQLKKDKQRQTEIEEHLKCKFIRISE